MALWMEPPPETLQVMACAGRDRLNKRVKRNTAVPAPALPKANKRLSFFMFTSSCGVLRIA
jgi:hypothetical protein